MTSRSRHLAQFARVIAGLLISGFMAAACSPREQVFEWTETVQMQDASTIEIARKSVFRGRQETFPNILEWYSVELLHPTTKEKVHWESKMFRDEKERQRPELPEVVPSLRLISILVHDRALYFVMRPHETYFRLNCPDPPYLLYEWRAGSWKRIPLEQIPYRKFVQNVSAGDLEQLEQLPTDKHFGVEVTALKPNGFDSPLSIDLTRMTRQTADRSHCRVMRHWNDASKHYN
jgi:hypothetical protein